MRIVCIGGGTGLFSVLSGLRQRGGHENISAIVSMMDSGGSTGRLRHEFGLLPPGDIRQCLVALSRAPKETLDIMNYRFGKGEGLEGHSLGNLILTAAKHIKSGEYEAIQLIERILDVEGNVYPVTLADTHLVAHLADGTKIVGETNIDTRKTESRINTLELTEHAQIFTGAEKAIEAADYIVVGPGDLFTSIMPNLVVNGMVDVLKKAKENGAKIIYVTNTMTKLGETNGFTANDFVNIVQEALDGAGIDAVIVNEGRLSQGQEEAYAKEGASMVVNDLEDCSYLLCSADLMAKSEFARHDPDKLAKAIHEAIERLG